MKEETRDELYDAVIAQIERLGFPQEFGVVVADQLSGEWSLGRMLGYLRGARPTSMEEIADELVAILEMRASFVRKKEAQRSQAVITDFYNREREP